MRALLQRVSRASVTVDEQVVGHIGQGLLVFLGISHDDTEAIVKPLADKIVQLRIFLSDKEFYRRRGYYESLDVRKVALD